MATCFRHANYATPLRRIPSLGEGRFHRSDARLPTQYFTDHPLGSWAEFARWNPHAMLRPGDVEVRIWAVQIDLEPLVHVDFDNADEYGIAPERLVSDDYADCQALADRLRDDGALGLVVPSAALPGTRSVVLFGAFVLAAYGARSIDPDQIRGALLAEDARPPREIATLYRRYGTPHSALHAWNEGRAFEFAQPLLFPEGR